MHLVKRMGFFDNLRHQFQNFGHRIESTAQTIGHTVQHTAQQVEQRAHTGFINYGNEVNHAIGVIRHGAVSVGQAIEHEAIKDAAVVRNEAVKDFEKVKTGTVSAFNTVKGAVVSAANDLANGFSTGLSPPPKTGGSLEEYLPVLALGGAAVAYYLYRKRHQ